MAALLYLVHRIPYPPNKGDKIRSFHLLEYLSQGYQVYLGAFVDDVSDWEYRRELEEYCQEIKLVELNPTRRKIASVTGLLTGKPLTLTYYHNREMQAWVDSTLENKAVDACVVFSSSMAQYVEQVTGGNLLKIIDFVDMDSDKWRQYSEGIKWPMSSVYRRESRLLADYERKVVELFAKSYFVSQKEASYFLKVFPDLKHKVDYFNNGVDVDFFNPAKKNELKNPYPNGKKIIVFVGAMDYWANVDAVIWFTSAIFPKLRERIPNAQFYIVGSNPAKEVVALSRDDVIVTGRVDDIRPYLLYANVSVAPLRIARGIQNKVLEAMAAGLTCVVSPQAAEGIDADNQKDFIIAEREQRWVEELTNVINGGHATGESARNFVLENFQWDKSLARFGEHLRNIA